jgi:hypothetical protein
MNVLMMLLKGADFVSVTLLFIILFTLDYARRQGLAPEEHEEFERFAKDVAERNIAANVAARVIQGGFTVGGFLFAGLFTLIFNRNLEPFTSDILIGIGWVMVSLIAGVMNLAPLTPQSVVNNVAITKWFSVWATVQFVTIIGAFARVIVLVLQYLRFI